MSSVKIGAVKTILRGINEILSIFCTFFIQNLVWDMSTIIY
jgi:hypothetical protein